MKAKLATHEADAAEWRDTNVNYWKEFSGRDMPVDDAPLSASIVVDGKRIGGFDLSAGVLHDPRGGRRVTEDHAESEPPIRAHATRSSPRPTRVPGQAVVKVTKRDFFGPIVKNYVFNMVRDTTLKTLKVNGTELASFQPDVLSYNAVLPAAGDSAAEVQAVANDPAATVVVEQAASPTGQAEVTVTNGDASSVYTVDLDTAIGGSDEFGSAQLGSQWQWVRPDDTRWRLAGGSLVITSQNGDLQGNANTARNLALQDVNGDWTADTKVVFSRPLANDNEQGGIVAHADDDNYVKLAWEMADADAEIDKLRVVVHPRAGWRPHDLAGHRIRRAADRRRGRRDLVQAHERRETPTRRTTHGTGASTGSWGPRR